MKKNPIKGKTEKELKDLLDDTSKKLVAFKHAAVSGRAKNVKEGRELRKDVARILTELNNPFNASAK